jgi:hypothetical protein
MVDTAGAKTVLKCRCPRPDLEGRGSGELHADPKQTEGSWEGKIKEGNLKSKKRKRGRLGLT